MPHVYVKFPSDVVALQHTPQPTAAPGCQLSLTVTPLTKYSGQRLAFHFLRVPCVGEIVDTRDATWVVDRVLHHAGEDLLPDATATVFVRLEEK